VVEMSQGIRRVGAGSSDETMGWKQQLSGESSSRMGGQESVTRRGHTQTGGRRRLEGTAAAGGRCRGTIESD
jgi:hypothetical protein